MIRANHPAITRIGYVRHVGGQVRVGDWELSLCATRCSCHRDPDGGHLAIAADTTTGRLGLVSHRPGCTCCQPWTWPELEAIVRNLADIAALSHS